MPIFEFKCERCGEIDTRIFSSYERMLQTPTIKCSKDGSRMERILGASNFVVTGYSYKNGYSEKQS